MRHISGASGVGAIAYFWDDRDPAAAPGEKIRTGRSADWRTRQVGTRQDAVALAWVQLAIHRPDQIM